MNQILDHKLNIPDSSCSKTEISTIVKNKKTREKKSRTKQPPSQIYTIILLISIIFILTLSIYCIFYFYKLHTSDISAKQLTQSFLISTLYNNSAPYSITSLNPHPYSEKNPSLVIGTIKIPKINLQYSILSYANETNLKKSLARFAGPMPNEIGNLCIAGHNNIDNSFFGKLNQLNIGDQIQIYDLSGNYLTYTLYNKYETISTDLSCTSQETNGLKLITLITCNSLKGTRKIYTAKAG